MKSSSVKGGLPGTSLAFNSVHSSLLNVGTSLAKTAKAIPTKKNPILEAAAQASSKLPVNSSSNDTIKDDNTSLGKGWFGLKTIQVDEGLKRDIQMIQMRNYMDPKRFYKNPDKPGPIVGIGTVIEGTTEYKSSRLTNKERKQNITEEILADESIRKYSKRVFTDIQTQKSNKRRVYKASKQDKKKKQAGKKVRAYF